MRSTRAIVNKHHEKMLVSLCDGLINFHARLAEWGMQVFSV